MLRENLQSIVRSQEEYLLAQTSYIDRELQNRIDWSITSANIITGVRRCGKSTLMRQAMKDLSTTTGYLHFDDVRLKDFTALDFYTLEEIWKEKEIYHFDEIHKVAEWELYIRQAVERRKKIGITGSNAHLMSRELGTYLTGRHLTYELFPYSYKEFLKTQLALTPSIDSLHKYIERGGFPEAQNEKAFDYLTDLFNDILQKDIIVRRNIRNHSDLFTIALHFMNNVSRPFTANKLAKNYQIKSTKSILEYISFLEDVYLILIVPKFSHSYKQQVNNAKKAYVIDHVLARNNSTQFQNDMGRTLENMVYLELRRRTKDIFYFNEKNECDFVIMERQGIGYSCYQSSLVVNNENEDREVNGLLEALDFFKLERGTIITLDQEDQLKKSGKTIEIIPFWKWAS